MSNAKNRACLEDLQATDPRDDKKRTEQDKGSLLRELVLAGISAPGSGQLAKLAGDSNSDIPATPT
jgi:hypothetical protein